MPTSTPARAVRKAVDEAIILVSEALLAELADVLERSKFDVYVSLEDRQRFFLAFCQTAELIPIVYVVQECRDPNDNKLLEVAVNGNADFIVTGDKDLLALNPFRDIPIVTPAEYLAR